MTRKLFLFSCFLCVIIILGCSNPNKNVTQDGIEDSLEINIDIADNSQNILPQNNDDTKDNIEIGTNKLETQEVNESELSQNTNSENILCEILYTDIRQWKDRWGDWRITVVAEVKNVGDTPVYLDDGIFEVENDGALIDSIKTVYPRPVILFPNDLSFYCNTIRSDINNDISLSTKLHYNYVKVDKIDRWKLDVSDVSVRDSRGSFKVIGRVYNDPNLKYEFIYLSVLIWDENSNPAYAEGITILCTSSDEYISFSEIIDTPKYLTPESYTKIEVIAYPLLEE